MNLYDQRLHDVQKEEDELEAIEAEEDMELERLSELAHSSGYYDYFDPLGNILDSEIIADTMDYFPEAIDD